MSILYTVGYEGRNPVELFQLVVDRGAILCDIRHVPRSRNPHWNKGNLETQLGELYEHIPGLGNVNYNNGGPVEFANYEEGKHRIEQLLLAQEIPMLLCVCPDVTHCHRLTAALQLQNDFLASHPEMDLSIIHL